jgi:hypothetical protein
MSMPAGGTSVILHPEALEANRQGRLTDAQRKQWASAAGAWTGTLRMFVLFFAVVGGVLLLVPGQVSLPGPVRVVAGIGFLVAAAFVAFLSFGGSGLTRDVRAGSVTTVEGPVSTDRVQSGGGTGMTHDYLFVANVRYECSPQALDMIGIGGVFRVYYLPRSRRVVNLERLADAPLPSGVAEPGQLLREIPTALGIHGRERQAETLASLAALERSLGAGAAAPPPPAGRQDDRPLAASIVGAWHGLAGSVSFEGDGRARGTIGGMQMAGRWSVGGDGKLHLEGMGQELVADAWVAGDTLTLVLDGRPMPFRRTGPA